MNKPTHILISLCLAVLTFSCGNAKPGEDAGLEGLAGSNWKGNFSPKDQAGDYANSTKVKMAFFDDETFEITPVDEAASKVRGSFTDMMKHQNLILDIDESKYDLIGKAGKSQDFEYEMDDGELLLSGQKGRYLLVEDDSEENENNEESKEKTFSGDWQCDTSNGASWNLNIATDSFRANVSQKNRRTLYFEGDVTKKMPVDSKERVELKITRTNDNDQLLGVKLQAIYLSDTQLKISELDKGGRPVNNMTCTR